jgi:ATP-dependent protease ClpP protease subunit
MIHELSDGVQGSASVIADHAAFNTRLTERITNIFLKRAGNKISREDFLAGFNRKEWWLSSDDMLKYGLADFIGFPIAEPELLDGPVVQEQQEL